MTMHKITLMHNNKVTVFNVESGVSIADIISKNNLLFKAKNIIANVHGRAVDLSYKVQDDAVISLAAFNSEEIDLLRGKQMHSVLLGIINKACEFAKIDSVEIANNKVSLKFSTACKFNIKKGILMKELQAYLSMENKGVIANKEVVNEFKLIPYAQIVKFSSQQSKEHFNQRNYSMEAVAWGSKLERKKYLNNLNKKSNLIGNNHREIGFQQNLYHFQPNLAPGMTFWHKKGWNIHLQLSAYMRDKLKSFGYHEINTPQIMDIKLWQLSGHMDKYSNNIFTTILDNRTFIIKPMSCPGHVQVFNKARYSFNKLPVRFSEFGCVHRNEKSSVLLGLSRLRSFVQDDGHIFCAPKHIASEVSKFIKETCAIYNELGFKASDTEIILALRPKNRIGSKEIWDKAEFALQNALDTNKIPYTIAAGEGAFYGPKIELHLKDSLGRKWQCGTIQLDHMLPKNLKAFYYDSKNKKQEPVMLHRAVFGSIERFMSILLEHHAGILPMWLAPTQVKILSVEKSCNAYAIKIQDYLTKYGYRVDIDLRKSKLNKKILSSTAQAIPYMLVLGSKDVECNTVSVRKIDGFQYKPMSIDEFINMTLPESHKTAHADLIQTKVQNSISLKNTWDYAREGKLGKIKQIIPELKLNILFTFKHLDKTILEVAQENDSKEVVKYLSNIKNCVLPK